MSDFSGIPFVTSVLSPATSTLHHCRPGALIRPYYFRVGGINYNNVVNYTVMAATQTLVGRAVGSPAISSVDITTMTATWTAAPDPVTGYDVEASTMANFTGTIFATSTTNTSAVTLTYNNGQLSANTTYFVRIGALYSGATTYNNTVPSSTSTLTNLLQNAQVYQAYTSSITVNWTAMTVGTGTNTSEGYRLEASSTNFNGGTIYFSSNTTPSTSTLTVVGLTSNVSYNLRVGALNWNNVPNFVTPTGSPATTVAGGAPGNPLITAVYVSSLTAAWGNVNSPERLQLGSLDHVELHWNDYLERDHGWNDEWPHL